MTQAITTQPAADTTCRPSDADRARSAAITASELNQDVIVLHAVLRFAKQYAGAILRDHANCGCDACRDFNGFGDGLVSVVRKAKKRCRKAVKILRTEFSGFDIPLDGDSWRDDLLRIADVIDGRDDPAAESAGPDAVVG